MTLRTCPQCERTFQPKRPHGRYCSDACRYQGWIENDVEEAAQRVTPGVGSQGGNVRSVQEARDLHEQHKDRWTAIVREAIRRTFAEKGELHADDLADLGIPAEHQSIIGSQIARLVNGKQIIAVDRRKCEHPAANGRKANVYKLTDLGRQKLAGVGAGGEAPPCREVTSADPGEVTPAGKNDIAYLPVGEPVPLFEPPTQRPLNPFTDAEAA